MAIRRSTVGTLASFLLTSCAGFAACTSILPAQAAKADFNGKWSVQWCDKTDPDADCGGFDVDLTHVGDKISGESFGARARLAQIDEGGTIHGIAIGNTAILTIESLRSGGIYLIEATIDGRCMHWKMRDTVRKSEQDVDIIATDDVLTKASKVLSNNESKPEVDCRSIPIRKQA
ncbi:hypothetical protein HG421_00010 [Xanthomonas campestris pv. badrii]|uniref:Lipoprotein n=1 Tax=Xanthomonas campestris pv. badrii TaxID=149696 RepID=A0A7Z2V7B9_XANCA|nr:hypothetical protein [Xanthomonas campestris]QJD66275.1 hypothetical protein HG421_00010 [Xanthomonas campestris pv. badrii]